MVLDDITVLSSWSRVLSILRIRELETEYRLYIFNHAHLS